MYNMVDFKFRSVSNKRRAKPSMKMTQNNKKSSDVLPKNNKKSSDVLPKNNKKSSDVLPQKNISKKVNNSNVVKNNRVSWNPIK